jgi:hypothetical protein
MKVGDLVRYRHDENSRLGLVIEGSMSPTGRFQRTRVLWLNTGKYGMYFPTQLEVINESR